AHKAAGAHGPGNCWRIQRPGRRRNISTRSPTTHVNETDEHPPVRSILRATQRGDPNSKLARLAYISRSNSRVNCSLPHTAIVNGRTAPQSRCPRGVPINTRDRVTKLCGTCVRMQNKSGGRFVQSEGCDVSAAGRVVLPNLRTLRRRNI